MGEDATPDGGTGAAHGKPVANIDDPSVVKGFAHPLRIRILALLDRRTATPVQLAREMDTSADVVIEHVRVLEKHGLIKLVRKAHRPGSGEHLYTAEEMPAVSAEAWDQVPLVVRRAATENGLAQINAFATAAASAGGFDRGSSHLARSELHLDEQGWNEVSDLVVKLLSEAEKIEEAAEQRLRTGESQRAISSGLVFLFFHAAGFLDTGPGHRQRVGDE